MARTLSAPPHPNVIPMADLAEPADWPGIFGLPGPLHVEIGMGRDTFLLNYARKNPDRPCLGIEYSRERIRRVDKKIQRQHVRNIRLLNAEAMQTLYRFIAPGQVGHFFIFFPDPWPKKRHDKYRLINPASARLLVTRLMPGGLLTLKTDDGDYKDRMLAVLEKTPFLSNRSGPGQTAASDGLFQHETLYEKKWRQQGKTIHTLTYIRHVDP